MSTIRIEDVDASDEPRLTAVTRMCMATVSSNPSFGPSFG